MFLDEIVALLEEKGVGTYESTIFKSSQANVPRTGASLEVIETGGTKPTNIQNATLAPSYLHPSAQIVARATDYVTARTLASAAYFALFARNRFILSGWYVSIDALQEPFDPGVPDPQGRTTIKFNIICEKKPTT